MILLPGQNARKAYETLETTAGNVDLDLIKQELLDVHSAVGTNYFSRLNNSFDWWQSKWDGQTTDGRKWWKLQGQSDVFPWAGASDTRTRLTKSLINEYRTLAMYALMNMKVQARSTRPAVTTRQSQQTTALINWQLFTHLQDEWHRETELAIVQKAAFGSSVVSVDWEQERRLDHVDINVMQFGAFVTKITGQQLSLLDMQSILDGSEYEKDLIVLIQELSPILSTSQARKILNDLRKLRTATIPVPYVFRSKPRIMALRPMIDVFFSPEADDLQRERWVDRVEYVTHAVLQDRVETDNYDPGFVREALKLKGEYSALPGSGMGDPIRNGHGFNQIVPGGGVGALNKENGLIELHHFYSYSLDSGVPCLYRTCFHMELDEVGWHGVSEYKHGQMPFHALRFETDSRPILSSQGIPETTYTWENELKVQFDARTDRASLALQPPMFISHSDVAKIKQAYIPNGMIPTLPGRESKFAPPPPFDPGSVEVSADIERRARDYFGWFGNDVDPQKKQMRQMEAIDRVTTQFKSVVNQIYMLDKQFLTDQEVQAVVGPLQEPWQESGQDIRDQHEITMTCDPRELDNEFLKQKFAAINMVLPWDTTGVIDRVTLVHNALGAIDYSLADTAIQSTDAVTEKEIKDEITSISLIVGSGVEQPLPPLNSNFGLRMQTLQNTIKNTPGLMNRIIKDQDVGKAIQNRALYFQQQQQQRANAEIGKTGVGSAFNHLQPAMVQQQALQ